jgi:shikimate kinase
MLIFIIGYMASGKTTIGRLLAEKLQFRFVDLDEEMESLMGNTISEIFNEIGEEEFREKESELLRLHLIDVNTVIATGGGTPCYKDNMKLMNLNGKTIFLDVPVETLVERLSGKDDRRPMLKDIPDKDLKVFITRHLDGRDEFYCQSICRIYIINRDPEIIVRTILDALN